MKNQMNGPVSRRHFLGSAGCAALTTTPVISTLMNLCAMSRASAATPGGGYKAVVSLFLLGGCDSYNLLAPSPRLSRAEYDAYLKARGGKYTAEAQGGLGLPEDKLLDVDLSGTGWGGPGMALHHKLPRLRAMFQNRADWLPSEETYRTIPARVALVANTGTLMKAGTNRSNWTAADRQPYGLFSHSDQQLQWQTTLRNAREATGWAGRMQDMLYDLQVPWSANLSIGNVNPWQASAETGGSRPLTVSVDAISSVQPQYRDCQGLSMGGGYGSHYVATAERLLAGMLRQGKPGVLSRAFHSIVSDAVEHAAALKAVVDAAASDSKMQAIGSIFAAYPVTELSKSLKRVAEMIYLHDRVDPGVTRQTFFVPYGGWDHHDEVINNQDSMFPYVDAAVFAFFRALKELNLGYENQVTLFMASDFGRTLRSNSKGSDHAWGSNLFVAGGAVNGGKIYGTFPADLSSLGDLESSTAAGHGRVIPTTSVDQYFATFARWMGVTSVADLQAMLPSLATGGFATPYLDFLPPGTA